MTPPDRPDPRDRPPDPAGTQPKVDPESLLPTPVETESVDGEAVDEEVVDERLEDAAERLEELTEEASVVGPSTELVTSPGGGAVAPAIPRETRHTPRFQFLFGALLALGVIAIAGAVAVLARGGSSDTASGWSAWHPSGSGNGVEQIADHVAREYRLPDGNQIVAVTGGPLEVADLPMQIALRTSPATGGNIELLNGTGVLYRMCGLGPECSISEGKPSIQRSLLLRREALELALYTFRYVGGVDQVVAFMPPCAGQQADTALLFRKGQMSPELSHPLRATLATPTPSVAGVTASPDAPLVSNLTGPTLYHFSLTQANQDASVFLVLESLRSAPSASTPKACARGAAASKKTAAAKKAAKHRKRARSGR